MLIDSIARFQEEEGWTDQILLSLLNDFIVANELEEEVGAFLIDVAMSENGDEDECSED